MRWIVGLVKVQSWFLGRGRSLGPGKKRSWAQKDRLTDAMPCHVKDASMCIDYEILAIGS